MPPEPASITAAAPQIRLGSIDAYRGFVMLLMMAEVLRLPRVASAFPGNWFWSFLAYGLLHESVRPADTGP